ncbi:MAG: DPP IV N-terminal domain-containing protein, partial [Candidatus Eremiobacteraeota bacterium]|nr:DPP IV N-terminal domain-containing protein [Candidatus Eremiobacteraeota bacterium]
MKRHWRTAALLVTLAATFPAIHRPSVARTLHNLTIEQIVATTPLTGRPPRDFRWSPNGARYVYDVPAARESAPPDVRIHDVARRTDIAIRAARAGVRGTRSRPIAEFAWSPDSRALAYIDGGTLRVASAAGQDRGTFAHGADDPQWSPDDHALAFVKDGNLTLVDTRTKRTRALTRDGSGAVLDGDPDWLYSEELDLQHGFAWSPRGDA